MERILFLDIDGVLNSEAWNRTHQEQIQNDLLVDREKIHLLATLVKRAGAKLILHSGWRMWFTSECRPVRRESEKLVELFAHTGIAIGA